MTDTDSAPCFPALLGIDIRAEGSRIVARMTPAEAAMGRPGVMHGGATATLLEQAARAVVAHAVHPAGQETASTIELASMTVDYLRVGPMAEACAAGVIVKIGARVAVVTVTAWATDESKPFAAAKLTFLLNRT